jgi:hypothetical protein
MADGCLCSAKMNFRKTLPAPSMLQASQSTSVSDHSNGWSPVEVLNFTVRNLSRTNAVDSIAPSACNHKPLCADVVRRRSVSKKTWKKPVVTQIVAGAAETSGGSSQEGGTGPATHAS